MFQTMKLVGALLTLMILPTLFFAQATEETTETVELGAEMAELEAYIRLVDSVEKAMEYLYAGEMVQLGNGIATLVIPQGYKYLNVEQSSYTLTELWGNPGDGGTLGMILKDSAGVLDDDAYVINITYDEMGYVDDEDAEDLDYDELLETMQEEAEASNQERAEMGFPTVELIGWAAEPYYDQGEKKLHWAKELAFEGEESHTLNYNVRVLGRKGVLQMNFIADIEQLAEVSDGIPSIMPAVNFNEGMRYRDFNPDLDKVAAVGIGGLIAGKVLAKTGFLAILAKFGKFIIIAIVGFFAMLRKRIFGGKSEENSQE